MKTKILLILSISFVLNQSIAAQVEQSTSEIKNILKSDCPELFITALNEELLKNKSALFIINYSSHPLGKAEFKDNNKIMKLNKSLKMNRINLLYVNSGWHQFHTMYQKKKELILYKPGEIYISVLTSRSVWPLPYSLIKEDEKGEFGPVLFHYINVNETTELLMRIKNQEIILNY